MATLILDTGEVVAVGDINTLHDGHHVNGEVWPATLHLLEASAPGLSFKWTGEHFVPLQPEVDVQAVQARKRELAEQVDARIASIYGRWTRFGQEYEAREAAARAYATAGYKGECSVWVTAFAEPAGLTLRTAADLIIVQADNLRIALEALGALRMRKYEIARAPDGLAAEAAHAAIMAQASTIEGGLQ